MQQVQHLSAGLQLLPYPTPRVPHLQVGWAPDGVLDGTLLSKQLVALSLLVVVLGLQALLLHLQATKMEARGSKEHERSVGTPAKRQMRCCHE